MGSDFYDQFVSIMSQLDTLSEEGIDYDGLNLYNEFNNTPDSNIQLNLPRDRTSLQKIEHKIVRPLSVKRDHLSIKNVLINTNANDFRINFETHMRHYVREWLNSLNVNQSFIPETLSEPVGSSSLELNSDLTSTINSDTNDNVSDTIVYLPETNNTIVHTNCDKAIQNSKDNPPSQQEKQMSDTKPLPGICSSAVDKITNTNTVQGPSTSEYESATLESVEEPINCIKKSTVAEHDSFERTLSSNTDVLSDPLHLIPSETKNDINLQHYLNIDLDNDEDSMNDTFQFMPSESNKDIDLQHSLNTKTDVLSDSSHLIHSESENDIDLQTSLNVEPKVSGNSIFTNHFKKSADQDTCVEYPKQFTSDLIISKDDESKGSKCFSMNIIALFFASFNGVTEDLNIHNISLIIVGGNFLNMLTNGNVNSNQLPVQITFKNVTGSIKKLYEHMDYFKVNALDEVLEHTFSSHPTWILIIDDEHSVAIFRLENNFHMFNAHGCKTVEFASITVYGSINDLSKDILDICEENSNFKLLPISFVEADLILTANVAHKFQIILESDKSKDMLTCENVNETRLQYASFSLTSTSSIQYATYSLLALLLAANFQGQCDRINDMLVYGNLLYEQMRCYTKPRTYISVLDMPQEITIHSTRIQIAIASPIYQGFVNRNVRQYLRKLMLTFKHNYFILNLTSNDVYLGVYVCNNAFYCINCYAYNDNRPVIVCCERIEDMCDYMEKCIQVFQTDTGYILAYVFRFISEKNVTRTNDIFSVVKPSSKLTIGRRDIPFENLDDSDQTRKPKLKSKTRPFKSSKLSKPLGKNKDNKKSTTLKPILKPNNKSKVKLRKQLDKKLDYVDDETPLKRLAKSTIKKDIKFKAKPSVLKQSNVDNTKQDMSNDIEINNDLPETQKPTIETDQTEMQNQQRQAEQIVNDNHLKDLIQHVMSSEALTKQHKSTMEHIEHVNDTLLKTAEQISDYRLNHRDMFTDVNEQTKILHQNQQTLQDTISELQKVFSIKENVDKLKKSQETKNENDLEWAKLQAQIQSSQMDHDLRINQIQSSIAAAEIKANSHAVNMNMQYQLGMSKLKLEEWKTDLQNTHQKESIYKNHEHQFQLIKIQSEIESEKQRHKDWYTTQENERERLFKKQLHDQKLQQEIEKVEHETRMKARWEKFTKEMQIMKDEHSFFMEDKKQDRAMQIEYDKLKSASLLAEQNDNIERYKAELLAHVKNRQIDKQDENEKLKLQFKLTEQDRKNSSCKYQFRVMPLPITTFEFQIQKSSESAPFSTIQTFDQLWNTQYESTINEKRLLKYKRDLDKISKKAVDNYVQFTTYMSQDLTSGILNRRLEYCSFFKRPGMFLFKTSIPFDFTKHVLNDQQKRYLKDVFLNNEGESVSLSIPRFIVADDGNFITDLLEYMERQLTFPVNAVYNINLSFADKICYRNRMYKCKDIIRTVLYNDPLFNSNTNGTCNTVQTDNELLKKPRRSVPIYVTDNRIVMPSIRSGYLWKQRTRNPSYF